MCVIMYITTNTNNPAIVIILAVLRKSVAYPKTPRTNAGRRYHIDSICYWQNQRKQRIIRRNKKGGALERLLGNIIFKR